MNYIIFDLEWNQCCGGRDMENPRMPFEIIEIGAVKLDKKYYRHILQYYKTKALQEAATTYQDDFKL